MSDYGGHYCGLLKMKAYCHFHRPNAKTDRGERNTGTMDMGVDKPNMQTGESNEKHKLNYMLGQTHGQSEETDGERFIKRWCPHNNHLDILTSSLTDERPDNCHWGKCCKDKCHCYGNPLPCY